MKVNPHTTKDFSPCRISDTLPCCVQAFKAPQAKEAINMATHKGKGELTSTPYTALLAPKASE